MIDHQKTSAVNSAEFINCKRLAARWQIATVTLWEWRKRYADFPRPYGPAGRGQRFKLVEVDAWFKAQTERSVH